MISQNLIDLAKKDVLTHDEVKKLTLEECHRVMWWWLHLTGEGNKALSPIHEVRPTKYACYVCEACNEDCSKCPVSWGDDLLCLEDGSLCLRWNKTQSVNVRKRCAKTIAELPWRE